MQRFLTGRPEAVLPLSVANKQTNVAVLPLSVATNVAVLLLSVAKNVAVLLLSVATNVAVLLLSSSVHFRTTPRELDLSVAG